MEAEATKSGNEKKTAEKERERLDTTYRQREERRQACARNACESGPISEVVGTADLTSMDTIGNNQESHPKCD